MTDNHIENAKPFARVMRAFFIIKLIFRLILINICAICAEIQARCLRRCGEKNLFENCEKNLKKL